MTNRQQQDAHHRQVMSAYYQDKDEAPLGAVLTQLRPRLLRLLLGPLGVREPALAEDVAQQALINLLGALRAGQYAGQGTLAAYAGAICRQEWLRTLGHQPSRPGAAEDPYLLLPASVATAPEDLSQTAEAVGAATALLTAATQAVLALDANARACVVLTFYHGLPAPAAAQQLGITEAAFHARLSRGLGELRAWGEGYPHPSGEVYAALRQVNSGDLFREPLRLAS